jgi:hypothetical protein
LLLLFLVIQVPVALEYIQSGIENGVSQICSLLCTPYSTTYNRDIHDKGGENESTMNDARKDNVSYVITKSPKT